MESAPVHLRNLERIHEGPSSASPRLWTIVLAILGAAAVASATFALTSKSGTVAPAKSDALEDLVKAAQADKKDDAELTTDDVEAPALLQDSTAPTTALVAVRKANGELAPAPEAVAASAPTPPPALDQLPVVPLPAGQLLQETRVTKEPTGEILRIAVSASEPSPDAPLAEAGTDNGGFLVQVASFKSQEDADQFVLELRRRGHAAFRQAANVPDRGLWHRVRIGSFKTKFEAEMYRKKLSDQEQISALTIDPEKVERAERVRAEKVAERLRKFGSE
jgi:cell division septation protein DedD